jgi:hypothetical protein
MNSQIEFLKDLANRICRELGALCYEHFSELGLLKEYLLFIGTWVEGFYHVDPAECVSDENCALKILDMFGTVFPLAIRDQYVVQVDEELFRRAVEKLLKLQPLPHSPALAHKVSTTSHPVNSHPTPNYNSHITRCVRSLRAD